MKNYYNKTKSEKNRKRERKFDPQSQCNHIFDSLLAAHHSNVRRSLIPFQTVSLLENVDCRYLLFFF